MDGYMCGRQIGRSESRQVDRQDQKDLLPGPHSKGIVL